MDSVRAPALAARPVFWQKYSYCTVDSQIQISRLHALRSQTGNGQWKSYLPFDGIGLLLSHPLAAVSTALFVCGSLAGLGFNQVLPFYLKGRLGWGPVETGGFMGFEYLLLGLAQVVCLPIFQKYVELPKTILFASLCGFWPLLLTMLSRETTFTIPFLSGACGGDVEVNMAYIIVFACVSARAIFQQLYRLLYRTSKLGLQRSPLPSVIALASIICSSSPLWPTHPLSSSAQRASAQRSETKDVLCSVLRDFVRVKVELTFGSSCTHFLLSFGARGTRRYGLTQTGIYATSAFANLIGPAIFANLFAISSAIGMWCDIIPI